MGDLDVLVSVTAASLDVFHLLVIVEASAANHWLRGPSSGLVMVVANVNGLPLHSKVNDLKGFFLTFAAPTNLSEWYLQLFDLVDQVHRDVIVGAAPI